MRNGSFYFGYGFAGWFYFQPDELASAAALAR
jgi:hypothetical protein